MNQVWESWSNEKVLEFLELYQAEVLLWNPSTRDHKNRNAVADAWQRIKAKFSLNATIPDLKKKKESLMSTYRLYQKKAKQSVRSGASTTEIFRPTWFAYNLMDSFLGQIYDKKNTNTINTETLFSTEIEELEDLNKENEDIESQAIPTSTPFLAKKRRTCVEVDQAKKQMDQAVGILKTMSARSEREIDEVDLFCQLLSKKIKKLDEEERIEIMHEIDSLMYNKNKNRNERCINRAYSSSTQNNQPSGSMQPQERVKIISNDLIRKAFLLSQDQYDSS